MGREQVLLFPQFGAVPRALTQLRSPASRRDGGVRVSLRCAERRRSLAGPLLSLYPLSVMLPFLSYLTLLAACLLSKTEIKEFLNVSIPRSCLAPISRPSHSLGSF